MMLDKEIADTIGEELQRINCTVAVAESVTGGFLQAAFTIAKEASTFFQGGITAYNVGQKYRHLLIEPLHALSCNSVSLKIAENMAKHVCDMFGSAYGIATTGYASPMPEKNINRLFTYYAISKESTILFSGEIESKENEGMDTQVFYTNEIMKKFLEILKAE